MCRSIGCSGNTQRRPACPRYLALRTLFVTHWAKTLLTALPIKMLQLVFGHVSINSTAQYFSYAQSTVDAEKARLLSGSIRDTNAVTEAA